MGMTLTEKILARHAGLDRVEPGQIINAKVDLVLANELSAAVAIAVMRGIKGASKVFDREKIALVEDHFVPAKDAQSAKLAKLMKDFAQSSRSSTSSMSAAAASNTSCCRKKGWSRRAR